MPVVDMPLPKLEAYKGVSPKPNDFDEYWDRARADLAKQDLAPEFIPSTFTSSIADCYDLYFTGVGGSRVHCKFLKPKNISGKCPAVLQFHGYSGDVGDWTEKLAYVAEGFVYAALDCRGQGGLSDDTTSYRGTTLNGHIIRGLDDPDPDKLYFRNVFLDTAAMAKIVMELPYVDETKVGAHGGSQGGALTLACAALVPTLNRAVPTYPFLCDYKRVWDMDLDVDAYAELRAFFRRHDPLHEREAFIWNKLGYIDNVNLAPWIKADIKMVTGLLDTTCPPSTQFAAYNNMTCKRTHVLYPDFGHEHLPQLSDITFQYMMEMKEDK